MAGSFGVVSLDAHTVAYNLVPLLYMLPLGVSVGLAVRMGYVIAHDPHRAKSLAKWCLGLIVVLGAIVACCLHFFRYQIIRMFTHDEGMLLSATTLGLLFSFFVFADKRASWLHLI